MRLLIADDDTDLARMIGYSARVLWPDCTISVAPDGTTALRQFAALPPDLVILDVMMPPPDGFEVCRRIRRDAPQVPILMLTARDTTLDEVRGLDLGADDYLTKPFDHLKLLARLRALARRAGQGIATQGTGDLAGGELSIDFTTRQVRVRGALVDLTPTEYVLLELLARNAGTFVPQHVLLERVWGKEHTGDAHYLKVFVNRLRLKLGDSAAHPRHIETRRGVGYRFVGAP
jgi:DNA-binding response OmpR family regulator